MANNLQFRLKCIFIKKRILTIMNLLFDFITLQSKTGAAEYVRAVFLKLLEELKTNQYNNFTIFALYDSSLGIAYSALKEDSISKKCSNIRYIDIYKRDICSIIAEHKIQRFFIGCAQYLGNIPGIENISCETYCIIHDLIDEDVYHNNLDVYVEMLNPSYQLLEKKRTIKGFLQYQKRTLSFIKFFKNVRKAKWRSEPRLNFICKLYKKNPDFHLISDSEYSKNSISFNYTVNPKSIEVLYLPERTYHNSSPVSDDVKNLIDNKKFFLLLSANRSLKNPYNTIAAFNIFAENHQDCFLAKVGYPKKEFKNHLVLPFLNDTDLEYLTKYCYALIYPSFFEGFGYPPIEAMKFGKPILASNTTSLPEILGDAAIFFSPLYPSSIYKALIELNDEKYHFFAEKSYERYSLIKKKSEHDLKTLLNYLLNGKND